MFDVHENIMILCSLSFTNKKGSPCLVFKCIFSNDKCTSSKLVGHAGNTLRRASYTFFLILLISAVVNCIDSIFSPTSFEIIVFGLTEGASTAFRLHAELTICLDIVLRSYGLWLCDKFSRWSCTTILFSVKTLALQSLWIHRQRVELFFFVHWSDTKFITI